MNFLLTESDNWGSDKFQTKFIEEYYCKSTISRVSSDSFGKKRKKRKRGSADTTAAEIHDNSIDNSTSTDQQCKRKLKKLKTHDVKQISNTLESQKSSDIQKQYSVQVLAKHDKNFVKNSNKKSKKKKERYVQNQKDRTECKPATQNISAINTYKNKNPEKNLAEQLNNKIIWEPVPKKRNSFLESSESYKVNEYTETNAPQLKSFTNQRSLMLKEKAMKTIQAAKFRMLNERLYTVDGHSALKYFQEDEDSFRAYHQGYQSQVNKWPVNPVDLIIKDLQQQSHNLVIADLGCGDAKIACTFPKRKIHSFDLVALNDKVTCCNISSVPLSNCSVDVVVFCLSLMGTNLKDYILEAHRILKLRGLLKIAEVESRIDDLNAFIMNIEAYGFALVNKDVEHKMFVLLDFNKVKAKLKKRDLPTINLSPCLYKKR